MSGLMRRFMAGSSSENYDLSRGETTRGQRGEIPTSFVEGSFHQDRSELGGAFPVLVTAKPFKGRQAEFRSLSSSTYSLTQATAAAPKGLTTSFHQETSDTIQQVPHHPGPRSTTSSMSYTSRDSRSNFANGNGTGFRRDPTFGRESMPPMMPVAPLPSQERREPPTPINPPPMNFEWPGMPEFQREDDVKTRWASLTKQNNNGVTKPLSVSTTNLSSSPAMQALQPEWGFIGPKTPSPRAPASNSGIEIPIQREEVARSSEVYEAPQSRVKRAPSFNANPASRTDETPTPILKAASSTSVNVHRTFYEEMGDDKIFQTHDNYRSAPFTSQMFRSVRVAPEPPAHQAPPPPPPPVSSIPAPVEPTQHPAQFFSSRSNSHNEQEQQQVHSRPITPVSSYSGYPTENAPQIIVSTHAPTEVHYRHTPNFNVRSNSHQGITTVTVDSTNHQDVRVHDTGPMHATAPPESAPPPPPPSVPPPVFNVRPAVQREPEPPIRATSSGPPELTTPTQPAFPSLAPGEIPEFRISTFRPGWAMKSEPEPESTPEPEPMPAHRPNAYEPITVATSETTRPPWRNADAQPAEPQLEEFSTPKASPSWRVDQQHSFELEPQAPVYSQSAQPQATQQPPSERPPEQQKESYSTTRHETVPHSFVGDQFQPQLPKAFLVEANSAPSNASSSPRYSVQQTGESKSSSNKSETTIIFKSNNGSTVVSSASSGNGRSVPITVETRPMAPPPPPPEQPRSAPPPPPTEPPPSISFPVKSPPTVPPKKVTIGSSQILHSGDNKQQPTWSSAGQPDSSAPPPSSKPWEPTGLDKPIEPYFPVWEKPNIMPLEGGSMGGTRPWNPMMKSDSKPKPSDSRMNSRENEASADQQSIRPANPSDPSDKVIPGGADAWESLFKAMPAVVIPSESNSFQINASYNSSSSKTTYSSSNTSAQQYYRAPQSREAPPSVKLYEEILSGPFAEFVSLSEKLGGDVAELGALTKGAFEAQKVFLWKVAGLSKEAGQKNLAELIAPTSEKIAAIDAMKNEKRRSEFFNHISSIAEGIPALGWVTVSPTPGPYVKEAVDSSQFYTNRVLKDFKEKDAKHAEWVKAWLQTLNQLQQYVKQNHTTGLVWNSAPGASPPNSASGDAPSRAAGGAPPPPGPPPPPPPPPADLFADVKKSGGESEASSADRAALFAELNKGLDITSTLKKVTPDMQTHKNPALKSQTAPVADKKPPPLAPKPAHLANGSQPAAAAKPEPKPVITLEGGKKWIIEHQKGNKNIVIDDTRNNQVVYIWKCQDSVVQIKGKVNSITMDDCKKTSVVFDSIVGQMEIINSRSAQVQTLGAMPTLSIQKTDGCMIYLSKESLDAEIVTGKSSEMNILVPNESGEFTEFPVPEQYKTVWKSGKLDTSIVDIA